MRTRIVRIGNSRGIRIPKVLLEQARLGDEVELEVEDDRLVISPLHAPREGWDEAFARMAEVGDDELLDVPLASQTAWDEDGWQWN
jgi:antitoxin MazE